MDMATSVRDVRLGSGFLPVLQDNLRKCGDLRPTRTPDSEV
jgi:hypothetical protein